MRFLFQIALLVGVVASLAACGVADVGLGAATTAKLQAEQARQAQATAAQITQQMEANNKATEKRLAEMGDEKR